MKSELTIHRNSLRAKTAEQWIADLEGLDDGQIKNHVGVIVWFDFFADETLATRVAGFDKYREGYRHDIILPPASIEAAMLKVGYHPKDAARRSKVDSK